MFFEQLEALCKKEGVAPTTLVESLGMSKGSIGNWSKGKLPKGEYLVQFSEHFGVSLDYLVYGKERFATPIREYSSEDIELLKLIHQLPREAKIEFRGEIKGYLKHMNSNANDETVMKPAK